MGPNRKLVYDFLELPHVVRLEIVQSLGLTDESDAQLSEAGQNVEYLRRAQARGQLELLRETVSQRKRECN